ncbi:MAG: glycosyltransferase family 39 protein [Patescibacteria group bacterium]|nr:glycosyltransferase family 39 protein [Patescibacteria group bacterium]
MKKYLIIIILIAISFLSACLFLYKLNSSPPFLNADEATNAYDAYSILKTGKDQYGNFLPLRFQSFGDYKLPLLTYLAIPWIKFFGLNELSIRLVNLPFVFLFPIIIYLLIKELFNNKAISIIASFLSAFSPGLQLLGRQAHEGYMTAFFLACCFYLILKFIKTNRFYYYLSFIICYLFSLLGYHSSRLWAGFIILFLIYLVFKKKLKIIYFTGIIIVALFFIYTDIKYSPTRIQNLLFFKTSGFSSKLYELKIESPIPFIHNFLSLSVKELVNSYLVYFSPEFLVLKGDDNIRFGFLGVSPITPIEYFFIFIGLYFLFKNKEKWRYLILAMILFSPISGALSWAKQSLTRTIFIFIPLIATISYGFFHFLNKKNYLYHLIIIFFYLMFLFYSWEFYLFHYPKKALVIRSWQAGYKELANYIKENYNNFDKFYITKKNGQPYIFLLFYLKYPPEKFQKQAKTTNPDEYGFTQINEFDKFYFDVWPIKEKTKYAVIGYPDDFDLEKEKNLKEIKIGTEKIFLIKEVK